MKKGVFYIIALVCFVSCHNKVDSDKEYMGFREVKKIYSFPEIQTLRANDMTSVNTPDYFIEDFVVYDSLPRATLMSKETSAVMRSFASMLRSMATSIL